MRHPIHEAVLDYVQLKLKSTRTGGGAVRYQVDAASGFERWMLDLGSES
jgi:hypothetical protein